MILNSIGHMPSHEDLVEMFIKQMKLDDFSFVKRRIDAIRQKRVIEKQLGGVKHKLNLHEGLRTDVHARRSMSRGNN